MTLFDAADALLRDALIVTAHARPLDGHDRILPGDEFVSTVTVENQGLGDGAGTAARTAFLDVVARVEARGEAMAETVAAPRWRSALGDASLSTPRE